MEMNLQLVSGMIRTIPDFPHPGILFRDITPVLQHPVARSFLVQALADAFRSARVEGVAGIEARGFLFGMSLADELDVPFIPVRKAGKLPGNKLREEYELEYGIATIEVHSDAVRNGQRILIHDDLLATGGTCLAAARLMQQMGAELVGFSFLIALAALQGKERIEATYPVPVNALITY